MRGEILIDLALAESFVFFVFFFLPLLLYIHNGTKDIQTWWKEGLKEYRQYYAKKKGSVTVAKAEQLSFML